MNAEQRRVNDDLWTKTTDLGHKPALQGTPKIIPQEKFHICGIVVDFFSPDLQCLQMKIQSTYPANYVQSTCGLIAKAF